MPPIRWSSGGRRVGRADSAYTLPVDFDRPPGQAVRYQAEPYHLDVLGADVASGSMGGQGRLRVRASEALGDGADNPRTGPAE